MIRYRRTTRITLFCLVILLGLGWARFAMAPSVVIVWVAGLASLIGFRKARIFSVYMVLAFGFTLGWWRGAQYMNHVRALADISKEKVVLVGTALSDSVYDERSQVSFDMGKLTLEAPYKMGVVGKVGVGGFGEKMIYRGDTVRVSGKFYPSRGSYVAYINFADLQVTGRSTSIAFDVTRRFASGLQNTLPEPLASFALGLLVGQRNTLPAQTTTILAAVGLTHIIAVSGYNLTILVRSVRRLLGKRSKFQTMVASVTLVFGFLVVTGASASIVRAAIISLLSIGAWYYGRPLKPLLLILFTAAVTALWNPLYIWSDIGWYLSFLAFFGVLILAPLLRARFFKKEAKGLIGEVVVESFSAQLMTLPVILYIFKTSSFVALPANLLVVPLIPLAMLLSFVAGLGGMILPALAGWVAWPARLVLTYLLDMATMFSRVPHMQFRVSVSLLAMLFMYGIIMFMTFVLWRRKSKNAKITEVKEEKQNVGTLEVVYNQTTKSGH